MKILISEVIWQEGLDVLERQGYEIEYDDQLVQDRPKLLAKVKEVDALIIRNLTQVDEELLQAGSKLKVIGRLGVGLDNIEVEAAKKKGIQVVYAKNANATSVAEYVMSAVLSSNRSLDDANEDVRKGRWDRKMHTGGEVYGKTLGLVGLGEIAHRVAKRAHAFGMDVVGFDPFITEYDHVVAETGVKTKSSLDEVLAMSDFISVHVPLTPSTVSLIDSEAFQVMKSKAYVINTSRGGIVNESDLEKAISKGRIAGAYLDVFEVEPLDKDHPLLSHSNVVITPHIAGLTEESQVRTSVLVAKEVTKVLNGLPSLCVV
ncbi:hydroxyacid dehydrogenase [Halobacillus mangrovi]|uniref:Hydroxyacid dehydrogenase n=1 Tax=Halobacillus mangrovi TaxID=402384 RepID=A0A1W5ZZN9_9BACI|nr:hydroxyacid dehydrogenase [Halobacillus mangrovi]ARI78732.1 hydroxyacid dehydrogenase [Halobacillus mangrovi]